MKALVLSAFENIMKGWLVGYLWNFKTFRSEWHLYLPEGPSTVLSMSDNTVGVGSPSIYVLFSLVNE